MNETRKWGISQIPFQLLTNEQIIQTSVMEPAPNENSDKSNAKSTENGQSNVDNILYWTLVPILYPYFIFREFIYVIPKLIWDSIQMQLHGKRIAVLGARGVGKTHLQGFLTSGEIPDKYVQTVAKQKTPERSFKLQELDLKIKTSIDVSGNVDDVYFDWKRQVADSDLVFYLLFADRLIASETETENRVSSDIQMISGWLKERANKPQVFIICTHCDMDPQYSTVNHKTQGDYRDAFVKLETIQRARKIFRDASIEARIVLGSMKTLPQTEKIAYDIFKEALM